jgi:beta-RFAP synthase
MDFTLASSPATSLRASPSVRVSVRAPARLHLGFLDPAGTLGRSFGSVGVAITGLETVVELEEGLVDAFEASCGDVAALERARSHVEILRRATGCREPLALRLRSALPAHAGLGSGTQLALAVGRAFCTAFDLPLGTLPLAELLGRGARSGVGVAAFERGGLLLDGGPRADGSPAPVLAHIELPASWRVILVIDPRVRGLSGAAEKAALAQLPPLPRAAAAELCHQVLMRVLPGAASAEFVPFAAGVTRMQEVLGEHFAPAQGGHAFASEAVGHMLRWVARRGVAGIGQSSWGSAGFAFLPSETEARALLAQAQAAGVVDPALDVQVVRARNHGALVSATRGEE